MRSGHVICAALFVGAGLINLLPLAGLAGASGLQRLYGLTISEPNMVIMLQHRAVLLGMVGVVLVVAACLPDWQRFAATAGLLSMGSYVVIALCTGGYNLALRRVMIADTIAILMVLAALLITVTARGAHARMPP